MVAVQNETMRTGLAAMLAAPPVAADVFSCSHMDEATQELFRWKPDVLVVICGRDENVASETLANEAARDGIKVLLLLESSEQSCVDQATILPAAGFLLLPELTTTELGDTLTRLIRGEMPMPSTLTRVLLSHARKGSPTNRDRPVLLTPRELQALALLVEGFSNKQIARRLSISEHGAKRHVANVLAKLNCPNRTMAVALALKEGMVPNS